MQRSDAPNMPIDVPPHYAILYGRHIKCTKFIARRGKLGEIGHTSSCCFPIYFHIYLLYYIQFDSQIKCIEMHLTYLV